MSATRGSGKPDQSTWREWHVPLSRADVTLGSAYGSLEAIGMAQRDVPLIVQLVENPRFDIPGIDIFHGAVDIKTHDSIHILLGRGLLPKDEAFVIGFTMGSTNKVTTLEENLYGLVSKYLYPKVYQFNDDEIRIFKDATKLGYISDCEPLDQVDYEKRLDQTLGDIRREINLECDLLRAYYAIELKRHSKSKASQRLLD